MHINKVNNKIYIGQTCQSLETRAGSNGIGYKQCPYFYNAIKKYGWDNFEHKILYSNLLKEEADIKEIECIEKYNSCDPNIGYNIRTGGSGADSATSKKLWQDPDYASRVIQGIRDNWNNPEYKEMVCEKMREAWKDPEKRKRRSDLTKERWANQEFHDRVQQKVTDTCKRSVCCIETGEVFDSIRKAANRYNLERSNISRSCKIGYKCGGFHWEYV